jgi:hypothetical protein
MYPNPITLSLIKSSMFSIDDETVDGLLEIDLELESRGGTGQPQITFRVGSRSCEVILDANSALTLSEGLAFIANATRRIAERHAQAVEPIAAVALESAGAVAGQTEPDPRLRNIWMWANGLQNELRKPLPDNASGSAFGVDVHGIKKCIEEIVGYFTVLQRELGMLPDEEPRFAPSVRQQQR